MKARADLLQAWRAAPQAEIAVIIHTDGPAAAYEEAAAASGVTVERVFRLTNTIAARGPAESVLALLEASWVVKVEPDQRITTMR